MGDSRDPYKSPESGVIESKRRNRAAVMIREERGWASLEQTGVGRPLLKLSPKKLVTETRPAGCRRKYVPEGDQRTKKQGQSQSSPVRVFSLGSGKCLNCLFAQARCVSQGPGTAARRMHSKRALIFESEEVLGKEFWLVLCLTRAYIPPCLVPE